MHDNVVPVVNIDLCSLFVIFMYNVIMLHARYCSVLYIYCGLGVCHNYIYASIKQQDQGHIMSQQNLTTARSRPHNESANFNDRSCVDMSMRNPL